MLELFLLLYADDIVLLSETETGLQQGLDLLEQYCDKWKLTVNINKTKIMVFRKGGVLRRNMCFKYKTENIEIVSKFTYLGVVFTSGGSFSGTHNCLSDQALKAIFQFKKYIYKFTNLPVSHVLSLFDKLITPILSYAGEVWGHSDTVIIERVHLHFCKNLLGVKLQTQNNFIYGELGRTPLKYKRLLGIIRYWLKIIRSENIKFVKGIYKTMLLDIEQRPTKQNWAKIVKSLLESVGLNYAWIFQDVGNIKMFLHILKIRLNDSYIQTWNSQLENSSRARTYTLFSNFGFKPYLDSINISKFRTALTRFRVSSHRLAVETGRWHKPQPIEINERKCLLCNSLEDEFHFIFECPLYSDLRQKYIKKYYWKKPCIPKFIDLLQNNSITTVRKLSMFIYDSFKKRNDTFYN